MPRASDAASSVLSVFLPRHPRIAANHFVRLAASAPNDPHARQTQRWTAHLLHLRHLRRTECARSYALRACLLAFTPCMALAPRPVRPLRRDPKHGCRQLLVVHVLRLCSVLYERIQMASRQLTQGDHDPTSPAQAQACATRGGLPPQRSPRQQDAEEHLAHLPTLPTVVKLRCPAEGRIAKARTKTGEWSLNPSANTHSSCAPKTARCHATASKDRIAAATSRQGRCC